jgi:serine/threonine-protein kinase RsbW/stage II sporulation protein AB (anti-sigma F factor)
VLRKEVVDFAATVGMAAEGLYDVRLAVSEALTNVVVHAYREAAEAGAIRVEARRVGDELEVVVLDDGLGMAPRLDSPGLGLGVPVISKLTGSHSFSQRRTGHGTRLCMRFAIGDAHEVHI